MKVKIIQTIKGYHKGDIIELENKKAKDLIDKGIAKVHIKEYLYKTKTNIKNVLTKGFFNKPN